MEYQVSARKHRPMSFAEVSGQPHVVRTLTNALSSGRPAHAYLFSGMRGIGKTTMARILAKALNCEQGPTATPCLKCPSCVEIGRGGSFDVMEIDGASSNSVDDIREMRETVKTSPARDHYRVYIIDEVHMLSSAAFNALLKTLEEPPSHVVFIFATTESHKIPQTILSRCQHFTFRRISRREVMDQLQRVAKAEGITIDERSLSALARASDGSMRDALSLLDQAVAFGGKKVTSDQLLALLGSVPGELLHAVLRAVWDQDAARALRALAEVQDRGSDLRQFCGELVEYARNMLVAKIVPDGDDLIELAPEEQAEIKADAARLALEQIQDLSKIFLQAEEGIRTSVHPWFVVEMAVVKASRLGKDQSSGTRVEVFPQHRPTPPVKPTGATEVRHVSGSPSMKPATLPPHTLQSASANVPGEPISLDWEAVVSRVNADRPNIGAFLENSAMIRIEGDMVTVGCPSSTMMMLKEEYQKHIGDACNAVSGRVLRVKFVRLDGAGSAKTVSEIQSARDAATDHRLREEALANPLVKEALAVFTGEIKEVRRRPAVPQDRKPD